MENHLQDLTEVPEHQSVALDELLVDFVLVKRGEDLISKQAAISRTLFQQCPNSAVSQILSQIDKKFSPKEQIFLEQAICAYYGIIKTNNLNQIYVYIVITDTTIEVDGEETVTLCTPMIFWKKPCESVDEQFRKFSGYLMRRIQEVGSKFKLRLSMVHEVIRKYGDSMQCEEIKEDLDIKRGCSICLTDYTVGCQAIQLPCHHSFCTRCILLWLIRNGSCPLCRYHLISTTHALIQC